MSLVRKEFLKEGMPVVINMNDKLIKGFIRGISIKELNDFYIVELCEKIDGYEYSHAVFPDCMIEEGIK